MSVPYDMHDVIRQALTDAREYRRANADTSDMQLVTNYAGILRGFVVGNLAIVPSLAASAVLPDGSAELAARDILTVIGALFDAADYRAARGDAPAVAAYRSLSRALGDDR
jgi:hypothetical protein